MKRIFLSMLITAAVYLPGFSQDTIIAKAEKIPFTTMDTTFVVPQVSVMGVSQQKPGQVYQLNLAADIPIAAAATGWSLYAFTKIYNKDPSTPERIASLRDEDVPAFDRWGIRPFDDKIDRRSYIPFYAAMPAPLLLLLDNKIRQDGFKVMFLYFQTMAITGLLYTSSMYFTNRFRPFVYRDESPMDKRLNGNAKNSFYAGHVHLVGSSMFFIAKVWSDYHPESRIKWVFYTGAAAITATTLVMRYQAGMHFPSDLLLGAGLGVATGILVPALHKNRSVDDRVSLLPYFGNGSKGGISLVYTFK